MRPFSKKTFMNFKKGVIREKEQGQEKIFAVRKIEFIILLIAAIGFIFFQYFFYNPKNEMPGASKKPMVSAKIIEAEAHKVSVNFPNYIKLNGEAHITQSYEAEYPNSSAKQATVVFRSSKSPKTNYDFYSKWAVDNGWQILNSINEGSILSLYLRKGVEDINITFHGEAVNISYVNKKQ